MLEEAQKLRTPQLHAALALDLNTGLRDKELREIRWEQIDLIHKRALTVGKSKSEAGTGRVIPLNDSAFETVDRLGSLDRLNESGPVSLMATKNLTRAGRHGSYVGWPGCKGPMRYGRIISLSSCSTMWQCQTNWPAVLNCARTRVTCPG